MQTKHCLAPPLHIGLELSKNISTTFPRIDSMLFSQPRPTPKDARRRYYHRLSEECMTHLEQNMWPFEKYLHATLWFPVKHPSKQVFVVPKRDFPKIYRSRIWTKLKSYHMLGRTKETFRHKKWCNDATEYIIKDTYTAQFISLPWKHQYRKCCFCSI